MKTMYFIHIIKPTSALMLKLYFLHTICHNSDMFRSILNIFRELNKAYTKRVLYWLPKYQLDILLIWHVQTTIVLPTYNQPNT